MQEDYKNKYEGHVYIKDGKIMFRNHNGVFYEAYISKKKVFEAIKAILRSNPEKVSMNNIISEAVKKVSGCTSFYHYKIKPSENSKSKIILSDPLYIEFEEYIKNLDIYKEIMEHRRQKQKNIVIRKEEGARNKANEQNLHNFLNYEKKNRIRKSRK